MMSVRKDKILNKKGKALLVIASILTIMMAIPHFFVPFIFPWERLIKDLYPPIKWALFAMNFFFSLLLLWGGLLTLISTLKWTITRRMRYWIHGGMGLFWLVGAIYEIVFPFPILEAMWVLPAIAFCISLLYWIAVFLYKEY